MSWLSFLFNQWRPLSHFYAQTYIDKNTNNKIEVKKLDKKKIIGLKKIGLDKKKKKIKV